MEKIFEKCEGFQWDDGNLNKNWIRHKVTNQECEQVFFNRHVVVSGDNKHSQNEKRWYLLGKTDLNRILFLIFTIRKNLIRVISVRDVNKKERDIYNEEIKKDK